MNKTVNINLANVLFHIDEGAYNKMRLYLESIKRSFANTPGSDEILADIEARIAELFHEKLANERQVITQKEVDEVITIMGQPEDYMVDEDIFEDEPRAARNEETRRVKRLYRDTELKYVAGVSSGLAHYVGVDPIWVRILWIILTIGSGGGFILLYGLLWILIPEATTTSQKLDMRGEDINISNIERKVKEGFDGVAEKVKNVDYSEVGNKVKNGGKTFFDTIGDIIMFFFKVFGKFIGIILIIAGAAAIIGMFVGMLTVGLLDVIRVPGIDFYAMVNATNTPVWLVSTFAFFALGIPFFFLLYLGLKILVTNLKSIGNIAKFSLLGLWLISIIMLTIFGIRQAAARAYSDSFEIKKELFVPSPEMPVNINLVSHKKRTNGRRRVQMDGLIIDRDSEGKEVMVLDDVDIFLEKSEDSLLRIEIIKEADGPSFDKALATAENIVYTYEVGENEIFLNDFLTTARKNKVMNQEIRVNLFIPAGTILKLSNEENYRCWRFHFDNDRNLGGCDLKDYIWKMGFDGELKCQECPEEEVEVDTDNRIRINADGIDININDEDGESFKMKINEDGVRIKAKDEEEGVDINIDNEGNKIQINAKDGDTTMKKTISKD